MKQPANRKTSNLKQNPRTKRWHVDVAIKRSNGTVFRKCTTRKTEAAARAFRDEAYAEFNRNEGVAIAWTLGQWLDHVQAKVWPDDLRETTRDSYAYSIENHVRPSLGGIRLDLLTVMYLQDWLSDLAEAVSVSAALNARTALSSALTHAVRHNQIPSNPMRYTKLSQSKTDESKLILTKKQARALTDAAKGTVMEMPVLLGLRFGLRLGECLGLRWQDVDFVGGHVTVAQQAQYVKGKGVQITKPKSKAGERTIPIPNDVVPVLKRAKRAASSTLVCPGTSQAAISPKKAPHFFRAIALKAGFTDETGIPTHHDLRSTCLSNLASRGVAPHVLMKIAGHSSIGTTMAFYVRANDAEVRNAMNLTA